MTRHLKSPWIWWGGAGGAVIVALCAWLAWNRLTPAEPPSEDAVAQVAPSAPAEPPRIPQVELTAEKVEAAHIRVEAVETRTVAAERTLTGRLLYDDRKHAAIRVATPGVIQQILVQPGDRVRAGQALALVSSPEIAAARADVIRRRAEWDLARRQAERATRIRSDLGPYVKAIQERRDPVELRRDFTAAILSVHREKLLSAYGRLLAAESLLKQSDSLAPMGVLSGRTRYERTLEVEAAEAALTSTKEQAIVDAELAADQANLAAQDAHRRWEISQQQLRVLVGYEQDSQPQAPTAELSLWEIRAPFAGTIEERLFSATERIDPSDVLFILADTSQLWVSATARESDWKAVVLQPGHLLRVKAPAIPERTWPAKLMFVGRQVEAESNALALTGELDNADGVLRPGLFVEVTLAVSEPAARLTIPPSALTRHEQQAYVFVEVGPRIYRQVVVTVGQETPEWLEVTAGLTPGDRVAIDGVFYLKSELLLEPEE